jgi:hypothetical protein
MVRVLSPLVVLVSAAKPTTGAHNNRSATSACVVSGNNPSAMQRSTRASARFRISEMNAKRS